MKNYKNPEEYIKSYPAAVQKKLKEIRQIIKKAGPKFSEGIGYGMPSYKMGKSRMYFGGFKDHVSFFPGSAPIDFFKKDLLKYKTAKGTIQFELGKKIPVGLITKIVKYNIKILGNLKK